MCGLHTIFTPFGQQMAPTGNERKREKKNDSTVDFRVLALGAHAPAGLLVLADAALVSRVIQLDACEAPPARFAAPASARRGPRASAPLTRQDVEGEGGVFWYAGLSGFAA